MNHVLGVVTALLALASASAATAAVSVSMIVSSLPIVPGGIITLQTFVTANAGEIDNTIFGAIQYNDALLNPLPASNTQTPLFSSQGALTCTTAFCVAFSQVNPSGPIAVSLTNALIATTHFQIDPSAGGFVFSFTWRTSPSTQRLDFFGLTNAPGTSVTVPEPTTAALLGVGLLGIAAARRRRRGLAPVIALALAGFAPSADAATNVTMIASGVSMPGSFITISTYVTSDGGEIDDTVFGAIQFQDAYVNPVQASNTQISLATIGTADPGWIQGALTCTTAFCVAFNQVKNIPATVGLTNHLIATTYFVIDPATPFWTVLTFSWRTTPSTQRLDWFGLTNAPSCSFTVSTGFASIPPCAVIPEPTTAALLGVGLLGLALVARSGTSWRSFHTRM